GDFDRNGVTDAAIGAPRFDGAFTDTGLVLVYLGYTGGLDTAPAFTGGGATLNGRFGAALAAGDVNGDRLFDLAVGEPGGSAMSAGSVSLFLGFFSGMAAPSRVYSGGTAN